MGEGFFVACRSSSLPSPEMSQAESRASPILAARSVDSIAASRSGMDEGTIGNGEGLETYWDLVDLDTSDF